MLCGKALMADHHLQEGLCPLLSPVIPFQHMTAAVIGNKNTGWSKEHPCHPRATDLHSLDSHFFDFTGTVKGRGVKPGYRRTSGGKYQGFFITEHGNAGILHGNIGFRNPVEPYPAWDFAFDPVSLHVSGKIEGKAFRLPFQQDSFCPLPKAAAAQLILIKVFRRPSFFREVMTVSV